MGAVIPIRGGAVAPVGRSPAGAGSEPVSDGALVDRALGGDRRAEDELVRRHARAVARLIARLLGSQQEVDDLSQEVFLAAFDQLDRLRDRAAFRGWLLRIAVNKTRMVIRKRKMLRLIFMDKGKSADATLAAMAHEDLAPEARAELAEVDAVLRGLPSEQRIAWVLRHVEGNTLREVSQLAGCSLATAKRRLAAAHGKVLGAVDREVLRHGR